LHRPFIIDNFSSIAFILDIIEIAESSVSKCDRRLIIDMNFVYRALFGASFLAQTINTQIQVLRLMIAEFGMMLKEAAGGESNENLKYCNVIVI